MKNQSGFSLFELIVVVSIVSMAAGIGMTRFNSQAQPSLQLLSQEIVLELERTRQYAIRHRVDTLFQVDLEKKTLGFIEGKKQIQLPDEIQMELSAAFSDFSQEKIGGLRFFADGSASGGRLMLSNRRHSSRIEVNWLTGLVTMTRS